MPVGAFHVEIHLPEAHSLKEKRAVIRGLKDRLRSRFNVSVAELGGQELWQRALVGVVAIGPDRVYLEGLLERAAAEAAATLAAQDVQIGPIEFLED